MSDDESHDISIRASAAFDDDDDDITGLIVMCADNSTHVSVQRLLLISECLEFVEVSIPAYRLFVLLRNS